MSTASPLPVQPLHSPELPPSLKQEVSSRLQQHRQRRQHTPDQQPMLPIAGIAAPARRRVADSVAARYAGSTSYRDFLQAEAAAAVHKAEAAADVARRTAEAVSAAQQQLLADIQQWNRVEDEPAQQGASLTPTVAEAAALSSKPMEQFAAILPEPAAAMASQQTQATAIWQHPIAEPLEPAVPLPANLIEFPRQLVAARKARPRLAEGPLREDADAAPERAQLRIFEVEASALSSTPAAESLLPEWHSIRLESQDAPRSTAAQVSLALPVYTAPAALRVMAFTVDACCITSALLLAVVAASFASPDLPSGLPAAGALAGSLVLFGLLYFLLFFTLNEATPGMRYARIGLCTFSDDNPTRAGMRRRLLATALATLPLGMGLLWVCLDEDGLGWHDRISRMYPREY